MGKGKNNRGQSIARQFKKGNIDQYGNKLNRPFNNSKRTKNSLQTEQEKFYFAMKDYINHLKNKEINNIEVVDEQEVNVE